MKNVFVIDKKIGETPLEAIEKAREVRHIDSYMKMTYAGRLDPMASGALLVLIGDECKKKDDYLGLDKTYEAEILLGITSDTQDILGLVQNSTGKVILKDLNIESAVENLEGINDCEIPVYSSVPVNGKSLFQWAREGRLNEINIPKRKMQVYKSDLLSVNKLSHNEIINIVKERISKVEGDFRQKEILDSWNNIDEISKDWIIISVRFETASGVYIRALANLIGETFGTGAILFSLKRTKIGKFKI